MPGNFEQWFWFAFFAGGALGGWIILMNALAEIAFSTASLVSNFTRKRIKDHA